MWSLTLSLLRIRNISSPTMHNIFVLRTAYVFCAFKNLWEIGHLVCTKQMIIAPFYDVLSVEMCP